MSHASNKNAWRPTATLETLKQRAAFYQQVRQFFAQRQVLEVDTPLMCARAVTDPYIQAFDINGEYYLQTSPEYAMKRMLAAGYGSIYQICKAFRKEEAGKLHNPEFTMLEWYRVGFDHMQLIDEVDQLIQFTLAVPAAQKITYLELFKQKLDVNPHTASIDELRICAEKHGINLSAAALVGLSATDWLQILMSHIIEPQLIGPSAWIVYDFPVAQAALARIIPGEIPVAARFEVYMQATELANGYYELQSYTEQNNRFIADNELRKQQGIHAMQPHERLIAALEHGLPDCAGVALGLDRLFMLKMGAQSLDKVISFTVNNA